MVTSTIQQALSAYRTASTEAASNGIEQQQTAALSNTRSAPLFATPSAEDSSGTFLSMVRGYLEKSIDNNYRAEELSIKAVRGEADLTEVITAVANAEAALRTVVTVRDRVIRSYEEIIRMPI